MSNKLLPLASMLSAGTAIADAPAVSVDIAPVHSLVAQVMEGVGTPDLIVDPGASPHSYQMRPSTAAALQDADIVFWVGEGLTPWLENALGSLAGDAEVVELLDIAGLPLLENREDPTFTDHDDDHGHEDHADHGHDDHEAHDHDDHHDEHAHGKEEAHADHDDDHHGHDHGAFDPHAWLSPEIAGLWLGAIAEALGKADPANAAIYSQNAQAAQLRLTDLTSQTESGLTDLRGKPFIVFHDAYQYFEAAFDIPSAGAILISDAVDPSPARIQAIQAHIREEGVTCVLTEPQFNPNLLDTVMEGADVKTNVIDPLGADLTPGPDLYPTLITNLVTNLQECLS